MCIRIGKGRGNGKEEGLRGFKGNWKGVQVIWDGENDGDNGFEVGWAGWAVLVVRLGNQGKVGQIGFQVSLRGLGYF